MKKSKLEQVLRRKVRIKITRRKRGWFHVVIPAAFSPDGQRTVLFHRRKRDALVSLYTKLRCAEPIVITVDCVEARQ